MFLKHQHTQENDIYLDHSSYQKIIFNNFQIFQAVARALFSVQVTHVIALVTGFSVTEFLIVPTRKMNLQLSVAWVTLAQER